MLAVLMDPRATYTIPMALENAAARWRSRITRCAPCTAAWPPAAHGRQPVAGGALAGTPYAADFKDSLLFLEEVNEEPYRIDRWMTQLDLAVGLDKAAGVMIGICENCGPQGNGSSLTLDETFDMHLQPLHSGGDRLFLRPHPQPVHDAGRRARHARYGAPDADLAGAGGQL
jgi:muramoyltetrapeptide carboxypeptidase